MNRVSRFVPLLFVSCSLLFVEACSVGPKYHPVDVPSPPEYKGSDWKPAQPSDQKLGGDWWKVFNDPQLNSLEQQIDVSNQNIKAAIAQYDGARAAVRYNRADFFPTLGASVSGNRNRYSDNRPSASTFNGATFNNFIATLDLSYELDAWGRVRHSVESARELAQASAADLATVRLSMHALLAMDYFAARTLDAQEALLRTTVSQYEQALQLNLDRYNGGLASEVDVEQAKTILETTKAMLVDVAVSRSLYEDAIAVLIGKPAMQFALPSLPLETPPPNIPVSIPSTLLERRPDIASAERRIAAANAQIGIAQSAYYPLIEILGSGGFNSGTITTLLQGPSAIWTLGPSVASTIFDGGRRRAVKDEAISNYNFTVAAYRNTVLTAFEQVQDQLSTLRRLEQEAATQDTAVQSAQASLDLSEIRYKGGVTSYLEVITAQNAALSAQITAVNILGRRMTAAVALAQAVGGGWDRSTIPDHPECCGKIAIASN